MTYIPIINTQRISKDYGYTVGGYIATYSNVVEKYDDVSNTWVTKQSIITANSSEGTFSLNGYGYIAGGEQTGAVIANDTERYDDILNTWTAKTDINTARGNTSACSLNGYGYSIGGTTGVVSKVTEKYNDLLNTWTAKANLLTGTYDATSFSLNGYGYRIYAGAYSEKYNDILNTWTLITNLNNLLTGLSSFSLEGYGYVAGGYVAAAVSAITEKYDDINNTWTAKQSMNTARNTLSGFSLNGYGYSAGGGTGAGGTTASAVVEKYDNILNTWTAKANLNTARRYVSGFSFGSLTDGIKAPDTIPTMRRINRELISVDNTASRAIDGTVYTNTKSYNLFVTVSARFIIDTAADVSNIQAFSDTNADPVAAASGIIGIEGGLAGEDVSAELQFIVRPYEKYKVVTTISAGCSATKGKWFETPLK